MRKLRLILSIVAILSGQATLGDDRVPDFRLGVQTHFEQGWSTKLIPLVVQLGAVSVRDEIDWSETEQAIGSYDFSAADQYMQLLLDAGIAPFIVITDTNPLYDDGQTPYSEQGIAGLANFVGAIYSHYGVRSLTIEIGNEVNSDEFVSGPFKEDKPANLAKAVRAVREELAQENLDGKLVCAGLNTISIEFFRDFFRAGGLQACDAISFHPYRDNPDSLGADIVRLKELMQIYGGEKPLYATEFGIWLDNPEDAPDYLSKMVVQLASAGVREAHWYALLDEPWWPNMGLLENDGETEKPAADAFRFLQEHLLPLGRPVSRSDVTSIRVFEFGDDGQAFAIWGGGGTLTVEGSADFFDTRGRRVDPARELTDKPIYVIGDGITLSVESDVPVADTMYQFSQAPWSYFALRAGKVMTPLEIIDWNWSSYRGAPDLFPLSMRDTGITTARFRGKPYHAIERFTAMETGMHLVRGWWQVSLDKEPSRLTIRHNGEDVLDASELTTERYEVDGLMTHLAKGDVLDFELAPAGPEGNGSVRRRIQIFRLPPGAQ